MRVPSLLMLVLLAASCAGERPKPDRPSAGSDATLVWRDTGADTLPSREAAPQPDRVQLPDSLLPPDSLRLPDSGPPVDASAAGTCRDIAECAKLCTDMPCVQSCLTLGCPSAQTVAQTVLFCGAQYCLATCVSGFTPACVTCLSTSCASQYNSCFNHTC